MIVSGFHEADITPLLPCERPGNYVQTYLHSVHDPLKVRACVFEAQGARVAVVSVDTCTISERMVSAARTGIEARCGIKPDHVMIAASHTHSGGPLFGYLAEDFADAPAQVRELGANQSVVISPEYQQRVIDQIIAAVTEADRKKSECDLSFGSGAVPGVSFNRRFHMKNGRVYTHPGKCNPDILGPAGSVDTEVIVLGAWDSAQQLRGCIVNFGCHATTWNDGASADWIYYLEQTLRSTMGQQCVLVFLNGPSGDVTQIDNQSSNLPDFGEPAARRVGVSVGAESVRILSSSGFQKPGTVSANSTILRMKRRGPSRDRIQRSLDVLSAGNSKAMSNEWAADSAATNWIMAKEALILDFVSKKWPSVNVEIQALQIGPALFISNPTELFASVGLHIKRKSTYPNVGLVTLANGAVGYVPDAEAFKPSGGGYETALSSYTYLPTDAAYQIENASLQLARDFEPPPAPPREKTATVTPWNYGVLGPELE